MASIEASVAQDSSIAVSVMLVVAQRGTEKQHHRFARPQQRHRQANGRIRASATRRPTVALAAFDRGARAIFLALCASVPAISKLPTVAPGVFALPQIQFGFDLI